MIVDHPIIDYPLRKLTTGKRVHHFHEENGIKYVAVEEEFVHRTVSHLDLQYDKMEIGSVYGDNGGMTAEEIEEMLYSPGEVNHAYMSVEKVVIFEDNFSGMVELSYDNILTV